MEYKEIEIPVGTKVQFNTRLPSSLREMERLKGEVVWGIKKQVYFGGECIKVKYVNRYGNEVELYANVAHWSESLEECITLKS